MTSRLVSAQIKTKYNLNENFEFDDKFLFEIKMDNNEQVNSLKGLVEEIGGKYFLMENREDDYLNILLNINVNSLYNNDEVFTGSRIKDIWNSLNISERNFNSKDNIPYTFHGKEINYKKPLVMGILNVTPDSFSDGGKYFSFENAVEHAFTIIDDGADIIDIGGESSRPGAESISVEEELKRIRPVVEKILADRPNTILSIDTTKSEVAEEMLALGAAFINDISGLTFDVRIADAVAKHGAGLIIMHMRGTPQTMQNNIQYSDVSFEIYEFLFTQASLAKRKGVKNIIIDPGIGFGKSVADNYVLINRLEEFKCLGFPIMVGISRKSFLGKSLGLVVDNRDNATICAESIAINNGAKIIRTHNVKRAVEAVNVINFINHPGEVINV